MNLFKPTINAVWLILCLATILSAVLSAWTLNATQASGVAVLGIAFAKAMLITDHFMEIKQAPTPLRIVFAAWAIITFVALSILFLVPLHDADVLTR